MHASGGVAVGRLVGCIVAGLVRLARRFSLVRGRGTLHYRLRQRLGGELDLPLAGTELAGRLLGYPRVGLATLVETITGLRMRKEHSAVDWSTRPLPGPWLEYAALDVEVLIELREVLGRELEETGKAEWARQEFAHLVASPGLGPRQDPWRRTSGMHRARGRRAMAAVRELWQTRDAIASQRSGMLE